jgi:hypothetical protein
MSVLLMLALLAAVPVAKPGGAIEATIRGTKEALDVDLLLRDPNEEWKRVAHRTLASATRHATFDGLESGVYQILLRGPEATEQLATKIVIGRGDTRRTTIDVEPFLVAGRLTLGGTALGTGLLSLHHRELDWRGSIALAPDGTFRATLWQRGEFVCSVRGPALPTPYARTIRINGESLVIDIPDGRVRGVVRDAGGVPVAGALVILQTARNDGETNVRLTTNPDGRFDFVGIDDGQQTVRIQSPRHLEPSPITFRLGANTRLRELDVKLDTGRSVGIVVIDRENDPVSNARVFAVAGSRICSRTTTDEDGRASVTLPAAQPATLFVVGPEGPFGMLRVGRQDEHARLQIHLPSTTASLLIRALTTDGRVMPPFSLLMRFNGELVPPEVADELAATQGLQLGTGPQSEAQLRNIPAGSYEFWPYRTDQEVESIITAGALFPPIQVDVRSGENKIAVKFAAR